MKKVILILITLFSMSSFGEDHFMVEVDPLTFIQDGYSLHLRYQKDSLVYGIGAYSLKMPKVLVELNDKNKDFEQKIDQGYVLFLDYTFDKEIKGWIAGIDVTAQSHTVSFNNGTTTFKTMTYLPRVGYHFEPFDNNIYLYPWAGLGYTEITSGNTDIVSENKKFDFENITSFVTLHVGYKF